jgi:hypothetical protein
MELVALWPLPPCEENGEEDHGNAPVRLIEAAEWYATICEAGVVYAAVRGDGERWRTPLRWSVLTPLKRLKGYDDRRVLGMGAVHYFVQPHEWSYRNLQVIRDRYAALEEELGRARASCQGYFQDGDALRREVLSRDALIDESLINRLPREELQRMANDERRRGLDHYLRTGDRALNLPLMQTIEMSLDDYHAEVRKHLAYLNELAGDRPKLLRRGGHNVVVYRAIAAELAKKISDAIPHSRQVSSLDVYGTPGTGRVEVLDRTAAIMRAVYGVTMTRQDVKTAADKRRLDKAKPTKK